MTRAHACTQHVHARPVHPSMCVCADQCLCMRSPDGCMEDTKYTQVGAYHAHVDTCRRERMKRMRAAKLARALEQGRQPTPSEAGSLRSSVASSAALGRNAAAQGRWAIGTCCICERVCVCVHAISAWFFCVCDVPIGTTQHLRCGLRRMHLHTNTHTHIHTCTHTSCETHTRTCMTRQ